jgi:hypothetical protein
MDKSHALSIKREFDRVKAERDTWNPMYQTLGEYISQVKQNFETTPTQGEFLTDKVFDSTGTFSAYTSASALLGMLWTGSAKQSIEIAPPDDIEDASTELTDFYDRMTKRTVRAMDDPKANLSLSLDEYMIDQIIFGTSGVGCVEGIDSKLLFKPYGVKELFLSEGDNGRVNKTWLLYEWEVERAVDELGEENVSPAILEKYKKGKLDEKVKILHCIRPRKKKKADKGKLAMKFESIHMDYTSCYIMKEEGFHELPIQVGRFRKLTYEKQGRSLGMNALSDIREANALREAVIIATEKALDMPKGVLDDGSFGGGFIDTSAKAITVFNASGNIGGGTPIFDIGTPPNVDVAERRLAALVESISRHFHIDKLLDFNNESQMTLGEAQIRDAIRTASLSSLFSRQIAEVFTPLVERAVSVLWRSGEFGVIPNSVEEQEALANGIEPEYLPEEIVERLQQGKEVYQVSYKTKAANASKAEEIIAINEAMMYVGNGVALDPSLANRIDLHEGLKRIGSIRGLPAGFVRQNDEVEAITQQQQQQAAQMQAIQAGREVAGAAKDLATAEKISKEPVTR